MSRIFSVLAIVSVILLGIAIGLGLYVGDYNRLYQSLMRAEERLQQERPRSNESQILDLEQQVDSVYQRLQVPRRRARVHMLIGILASLVTILVNSISVTYFIGTSRWCKEVVQTYELDQQVVAECTRLKRHSFLFAMMGMMTTLAIVALGGAADPGTLRATTSRWVLPHFGAALGGSAFIAFSFFMQAECIRRNSQIVENILQQVHIVRSQRGLATEKS